MVDFQNWPLPVCQMDLLALQGYALIPSIVLQNMFYPLHKDTVLRLHANVSEKSRGAEPRP